MSRNGRVRGRFADETVWVLLRVGEVTIKILFKQSLWTFAKWQPPMLLEWQEISEHYLRSYAIPKRDAWKQHSFLSCAWGSGVNRRVWNELFLLLFMGFCLTLHNIHYAHKHIYQKETLRSKINPAFTNTGMTRLSRCSRFRGFRYLVELKVSKRNE